MRKSRVLIIGDGRIGRAVASYCKKDPSIGGADFFTARKNLSSYDLFIGALPGEVGQKGLALALRWKKNLLDLSDVDPPFYLHHRKAVEKCGILVVPGCGFSPGLVNCILGREAAANPGVKDIEIKAGSLARTPHYFPFLWCFEDLMLEHRIPSWQIVDGRKIKCGPLEGYRKERIFGIAAESYYCASGFENVLEKMPARNFICRVVRPEGFREFLLFLDNQSFLSRANHAFSKRVAESRTEDNSTFAEIVFSAGNKKRRWLLKSFSRKGEALNSMQKITASVPAVLAGWIAEGTFKNRGVVFMEELGKDPTFFPRLIAALRAQGIEITRKTSA